MSWGSWEPSKKSTWVQFPGCNKKYGGEDKDKDKDDEDKRDKEWKTWFDDKKYDGYCKFFTEEKKCIKGPSCQFLHEGP